MLLLLLLVLFPFLFDDLSGLTPVDCVFPALVKLAVFVSDAVVKNWGFLDGLEHLARLLAVRVFIVRLYSHVYHVHDILSVWILLLP